MGGVSGIGQAPFDPNDAYQAMVGVTTELVMARDGRIVEFGGFDELLEAVLDRIAVPAQRRDMLGQFFEANFGSCRVWLIWRACRTGGGLDV